MIAFLPLFVDLWDVSHEALREKLSGGANSSSAIADRS
jgi:hypothetical protein